MKVRKTKPFNADLPEITDILIGDVCNLMAQCKEDSSRYYACSVLLEKLSRISKDSYKQSQKQSKDMYSLS
jgi:hypothetical protein